MLYDWIPYVKWGNTRTDYETTTWWNRMFGPPINHCFIIFWGLDILKQKLIKYAFQFTATGILSPVIVVIMCFLR